MNKKINGRLTKSSIIRRTALRAISSGSERRNVAHLARRLDLSLSGCRRVVKQVLKSSGFTVVADGKSLVFTW